MPEEPFYLLTDIDHDGCPGQPRDYLAEALAIIKGQMNLQVTRQHLLALHRHHGESLANIMACVATEAGVKGDDDARR